MNNDTATATVPTEIDALRAELATVKRRVTSAEYARAEAASECDIAVAMLRHLIEDHAMEDEIKAFATTYDSDAVSFARNRLDIDMNRTYKVTKTVPVDIFISVEANSEEDAKEQAENYQDYTVRVDGKIDGWEINGDEEITYCEEEE